MRVKTEIWVGAYLRRCMGEGLAVYVAARGDPFAGAVFICVDNLAGACWLYGPAPAGLEQSVDERRWTACFAKAPVSVREAEEYLRRQKQYDPDLWVIELEDRQGRHFLGDELVAAEG